jgi:hypothetical protein
VVVVEVHIADKLVEVVMLDPKCTEGQAAEVLTITNIREVGKKRRVH